MARHGYDAEAVIDLVRSGSGCTHIPTGRDRKIQRPADPYPYCRRDITGRRFCKLKHVRRVANRFDTLAHDVLAAVLLASLRLRA